MSILHRRRAVKRRAGKDGCAPHEFARASERCGGSHDFSRQESVPHEYPAARHREGRVANAGAVEAPKAKAAPRKRRKKAKRAKRAPKAAAAAPVVM